MLKELWIKYCTIMYENQSGKRHKPVLKMIDMAVE